MHLRYWDTPFGRIKHLVCAEIDQEVKLVLILEEHLICPADNPGKEEKKSYLIGRTSESRVWRVTFDERVALKVTAEAISFHWQKLKTDHKGRSAMVMDSPWIQELRKEAFFDMRYPNPKHFLILTENDTIEVISVNRPKIEDITGQHHLEPRC